MNIFEEIGYGIAFALTGAAAKADIALSSIGISTGGGCSSGGTTAARQEGKKPTNPPENNETHRDPENNEPTNDSRKKSVNGGVEADMKARPVPANAFNLFNNTANEEPKPPKSQQKKQDNVSDTQTVQATGHVMHAIDMPKKVKPQVLDQEPVDVEMDNNTKDIISMMRRTKNNASNIPITDTPIGKIAKEEVASGPQISAPKLESRFPDNQKMIKTYPYLKDIEQIALDNGYQILFAPHDPIGLGIVVCQVYDNNTGMPINNKGFSIDPGNIIDKRVKLFAGIYKTYEGIMAYHVFSIDKKLNVEFIRDIIVGGITNLTRGRPIYNKDVVVANCFFDLTTMPTNLNKEDRKFVQDVLVRASNSNLFDSIVNVDKTARFRIVTFDKRGKIILVDSKDVPKHFGYPYVANVRRTFVLYYHDTEKDENGNPKLKATETFENGNI